MGRYRDQANIALMIPPRPVIGRNRQQPRIFPLRTGIRLHRHRVITRYFTKLF